MRNTNQTSKSAVETTTDLLLLPDGRVLVHHLTPAMAEVLKQLNPHDEQIQLRVHCELTHSSRRSRTKADHASRITIHELPN